MFRFDYSTDFLQWALKPPGFLRRNGEVTRAFLVELSGHGKDKNKGKQTQR